MIKIGLVGTGFISSVHAIAAKEVNDVKIDSIFSRDIVKAKKFAEEFEIQYLFDNYTSMINSDIDAVIIGIPTPFHKIFSIEALNKGKHVLCEKPIALTVNDAIEMKNTAEKTGKILMIAHVLRFWPEYQCLKKMVEENKIGNIKKIYAYRFSSVPKWSKKNWLLDYNQSGGVPVDLQIHDIDFILWLLGKPKKYYSTCVFNTDGLIINSTTVFQYKDSIAIADAGYILGKDFKFEMGFKIISDTAKLNYNNLRQPTLIIEKPDGSSEPVQFENKNPYSNQIAYFAKCVSQSRQPEIITLSDAVRSLQIAIDVKSSSIS